VINHTYVSFPRFLCKDLPDETKRGSGKSALVRYQASLHTNILREEKRKRKHARIAQSVDADEYEVMKDLHIQNESEPKSIRTGRSGGM
jgi:hypothetical protein